MLRSVRAYYTFRRPPPFVIPENPNLHFPTHPLQPTHLFHSSHSTHLRIQNTTLPQAPVQLWLQEFTNRNILGKALPPSRLEHEISRQRLRTRRLQRSEFDVLIERIARYDGPAVENKGERDLALSVDLVCISIKSRW
jgi:hypothetical protein